MNKQRKTSHILNVFQYDHATGIIGLNGAPVSGYGLYLTTNINDGSVGIDSSASINALYLLKNTTKQFEISYDTSGATKIFRLLPYQSGSFFQIGNPSNAANSNSDYVFISEATYGNVLIGPGIGNAVSNLTGATASIHKVQFNGAVFANNSIQATSFKITGGVSTGFLKADGTVDTVTYLSGNQSITVSGDATGSGTTSIALTLANTAVTPGVYGSTTLVPVVTVDSKGRITSVTTAAISGSLTFTGDVTGSGTTGTSTAMTLAASGVTAGTYTKVTVDSKGRVTVGASATTSDISEGTNLYYTDARVLSYLSANTYATQSYVNTQVSNLVAAAPATLDTLNELAAALGNDPSFATTISTALGNRLRVDINNQGLSATLQGYGRTNLGLGTAATSNAGDFVAYRTFGTAANSAIGDFVAYRTFGTAANNNTGDFALASHTHSIADVTGLQTALDGKQASGSYAASSHSHIISDITGLQTALDGKQASLGYTPYNSTNPSGYITSSALSSYLPLSGGTLTGALTISTTEDGKLVLRAPSGDSSQWNYINFVGTDGVRDAYFGTDGSGNPQWWRDDNSLRITLGSTATINDVQIVTNSGTWGINVSGTAGSISGFNNPTTSPTANTIMYRDGSGYVQAVYYYSSNAGRETTGINSLTGKVSAGAGYMYEFTAAAVQTFLGLGSLAYSSATIPTNNNQLTNGAGYITSYSETDTLASVTGRGNTTTSSMAIGSGSIPNGKLYVNSGSGSDVVALQNTLNTGAYLVFADTVTPTWANAPRLGAISNDMVFKTLDTERFRIASTGASTFTGPSLTINTTGDIVANGDAFRMKGGGGSAEFIWYRNYSGSPSEPGFVINNRAGATTFSHNANGGGTSVSGNFSAANFSGSSSGTNTGDQTNISGNAGTVTNGLYTNNYSGTLDGRYFFDYGFTTGYPGTEANAMPGNRSAFTYSNGAPLTGCIAHFGAAGYGIQLNGDYQGDSFSMRSRNGDNATWRPWKRLLTDYNYNSYSPTLTGTGASGTWAISISGTAGSISGFNNPTTGATANTIAYRDSGGDLYARYMFAVHFNQSGGNSENPTIGQIWTQNTTDNYVRKSTPAHLISQLGLVTGGPYLPLSGGTMNGVITLNDNGYLKGSPSYGFRFNNSADSINAMIINNSGDVTAYSSMRAPIFYDSNDTSYYLNPAGGSRLRNLYVGDSGDDWSDPGGWGTQIRFSNGPHVKFVLHARTPGIEAGMYVHTPSSVYIGSYTSHDVSMMYAGNRKMQITNSYIYTDVYLEAAGSLRAPIFYDSQDTGYYLDPNSTGLSLSSNGIVSSGAGTTGGFQNRVYVGGRNRIWSFGNADGYGISYFQGGPDYIGLHVSGNPTQAGSDFWVSSAGIAQASGSMRAPIFYDSNDTGYYLDPNGTSNLQTWTADTAARLGRSSYWTNRWAIYNTVNGHMTGTNGWGMDHGGWGTAWKGGFSGWDIWGSSTDHPQGSGYVHAQGIISGQHAAASDGSTAYGWMMVGAHNATDNRYWLRGKWGGSTSGWVEMVTSGNISSQTVSNSDMVDGYHASNFLGYNGNSYYQVNTWLQMNGTHGVYWPSYYGIHIYANTTSTYTQLRIDGVKNSYTGVYLGDSAVNGMMYDTAGNGGVYREANGIWYFYYHIGNNCMGVGTSTTSSSYKMYVNGTVYATGDVIAYSDARKKTNIVTIDKALETVTKMRGVFYDKIGEESNGRQLGVIAQEVNKVLPEAVNYASDIDEYGVKYGNIVGVLIEAIKEQQGQIEELKNKLDNVLSSR